MDKSILFSAPMVRAILEGRKTQTRRALPKAHPSFPKDNQIRLDVLAFDPKRPEVWYWDGVYDRVGASYPIRYAVGDRLYVREAWGIDAEPVCCGCPETIWDDDGHGNPVAAGEQCCGRPEPSPTIAYRAEFATGSKPWDGKWRPSIHMPRSASRLTLTVTDVRVQRLQDISEADAVAEGIRQDRVGAGTFIGCEGPRNLVTPWPTAREAFADLWDSLAKPGATWADNPWIVAITFDTHHCNIDAMEASNG